MIDDIHEIIKNSYKNFHAKGLDYICLSRSEFHTRKIYILDGDVTSLPEVVNPHDHRYNFKTTVLAGEMSNKIYLSGDEMDNSNLEQKYYNLFSWKTPLNGGDGFTFIGERKLVEHSINKYCAGDEYLMYWHQIHTIQMRSDQTILLLDQYRDEVSINTPTLTYCQEKQPPSLDGLYEKFTEAEIHERLKLLSKFELK